MGSSGQSWGATLRVPILALGWSRPGCSCPVSTSAVTSPAPEKTGSAQSPQEACVCSLPTPGPLQNANSPITTGTTQWRQKRSGRPSGWPSSPTDRLQHSAAGGHRVVSSRGLEQREVPRLWVSCLPLGSQPSPQTNPEPGLLWPLLNQNMGSGVTEKPFLCPGGWHLRTLGPVFRR